MIDVNKIDWEGLIKAVGEEATEETLQVLKDNKEFLSGLARDELVMIMHNIVSGDDGELNAAVYSAMLSQLTDDEFLELRKKSVESAKVWASLNKRKDKVIKDIKSKVSKATANIIIRYVLLGGL